MPSGNPNIAEAGKNTRFKPGVVTNPKGVPKGSKHLSTYIHELMDDENFQANILDAKYGVIEYKGAPAKAIVQVAVAKAVNGDKDSREWLAKYGYGTKLDMTTNGKDLPTPIIDITSLQEPEEEA